MWFVFGYSTFFYYLCGMDEKKKYRYRYMTVGYGVFSLLGTKYRMGRVEVYDRENDSGFASNEGTYCMPFEAAQKFEDFIESLKTDLPIQLGLGSIEECRTEVCKELGITREQFNDKEFTGKWWADKAQKEIDKLK